MFVLLPALSNSSVSSKGVLPISSRQRTAFSTNVPVMSLPPRNPRVLSLFNVGTMAGGGAFNGRPRKFHSLSNFPSWFRSSSSSSEAALQLTSELLSDDASGESSSPLGDNKWSSWMTGVKSKPPGSSDDMYIELIEWNQGKGKLDRSDKRSVPMPRGWSS